MELTVGDNVVYPKHGVGQIINIEEMELVEGFSEYYVIDIPTKRLTLRIPVDKIDELGVRPVIRRSKLDIIMETLRGEPNRLSKDNKQRQGGLREKLGAGYAIGVAEAVRDLTWHKELEHLTKADSDLLAWGQDLLTAELAIVTDSEVTEAKDTITSILSNAMASQLELA
jgi:CarD family transcriptional regulator